MLAKDNNDKMVSSKEASLFNRRIESEIRDLKRTPVKNIATITEEGGRRWIGIIYGLGSRNSSNICDPSLSLTSNPLENSHVDVSTLEKGRYNPEDDFFAGEYLFEIILSPRYPLSPPDFFFLTPNGRFKVNSSICFSNSSYHPDSWSPSWTIRHMLIGLLSFFLEEGKSEDGTEISELEIKKERNFSTGVGHISRSTSQQIKDFAAQSKAYNLANHRERYLRLKAENGLV